MNSWLGFIHQGLPPWKKRQASLGALMVCLTRRLVELIKASTPNGMAQWQGTSGVAGVRLEIRFVKRKYTR